MSSTKTAQIGHNPLDPKSITAKPRLGVVCLLALGLTLGRRQWLDLEREDSTGGTGVEQ